MKIKFFTNILIFSIFYGCGGASQKSTRVPTSAGEIGTYSANLKGNVRLINFDNNTPCSVEHVIDITSFYSQLIAMRERKNTRVISVHLVKKDPTQLVLGIERASQDS